MISGFDDWGSDLFFPKVYAPVSHAHEVSVIERISSNVVDWTQVTPFDESIGTRVVDFNLFLWLFGGKNDRTLFSSDQVFGSVVRDKLQRSRT